MTNKMIIEMEKQELVKNGILKYTGRIMRACLPDGSEVDVPEIQPIHTFAGWKSLGYCVRKGEHAVAKFPIWKQGKGKTEKNEAGEEVERAGRMFMKMSHFFTDEQVDPIENQR